MKKKLVKSHDFIWFLVYDILPTVTVFPLPLEAAKLVVYL